MILDKSLNVAESQFSHLCCGAGNYDTCLPISVVIRIEGDQYVSMLGSL